MVSQETSDFVFSVVDAGFEYNTKMLILCTLLLYSLFLFGFTYWIERKSDEWNEKKTGFSISKTLLKRFYRWVSGAILFVFPLMFLFGYRGASLETLLNLIYGLYIAFMGGMAIWGIAYFIDRIKEWTGISGQNTRKNGSKRFKKK